MKIKYYYSNGKTFLPTCPHKIHTPYGIPLVGSLECKKCKYFKEIDMENQTIYCTKEINKRAPYAYLQTLSNPDEYFIINKFIFDDLHNSYLWGVGNYDYGYPENIKTKEQKEAFEEKAKIREEKLLDSAGTERTKDIWETGSEGRISKLPLFRM